MVLRFIGVTTFQNHSSLIEPMTNSTPTIYDTDSPDFFDYSDRPQLHASEETLNFLRLFAREYTS